MTEEQIVARMKDGVAHNNKCYKDGAFMSGAIYLSDDRHWEFIAKIQGMFMVTNPLH